MSTPPQRPTYRTGLVEVSCAIYDRAQRRELPARLTAYETSDGAVQIATLGGPPPDQSLFYGRAAG